MKILEDGRIQFRKGIPESLKKHQTVQVTVTMPYDKNGPMLQPVVKKTMVFYNTTFMEAVVKAQSKHRGASISVNTLAWKPLEEKKEIAGGNA